MIKSINVSSGSSTDGYVSKTTESSSTERDVGTTHAAAGSPAAQCKQPDVHWWVTGKHTVCPRDAVLLSLKTEGILTPATTRMDVEAVMLHGVSQTQKHKHSILWSHSHTGPGIRSQRQKVEWRWPGAWEGRQVFNGDGVSVWEAKNVLETAVVTAVSELDCTAQND